MQSFQELNNVLENCCQMALKQPLKDKQMVLMTDASHTAAGYALMTEDDPNQKNSIEAENLCASRIWVETVQPYSNKTVNICEGILGNIFRIY